MKLSKLGDYLKLNDLRNKDLLYEEKDVKGISINKIFIETKANLKNVSLHRYKVIKPTYFAYVTVTSRNGDKVSIAYNDSKENYIVSSSYVSFYVKDTDKLMPEYLYMYFNRPEFDRIARFNSWGSARETFSWEDLCDLNIYIPPIEIQRKYVSVYLSLKENATVYEKGFEDLALVSEGYIDSLKKKYKPEMIGKYITERKEKNTDSLIKTVRGVSSIEKNFIQPRRRINPNNLHNYNVVSPLDIAYRPIVTGYDDTLNIALSREKEKIVVSPIYPVFYVNDTSKLLPEYLFMWLKKDSFDKYAWYFSTGSARETLDFDILGEYKIPIPPIEVQESIINIFEITIKRKKIFDNIKSLTNDICSVLIKGAVYELEEVI